MRTKRTFMDSLVVASVLLSALPERRGLDNITDEEFARALTAAPENERTGGVP